MARKTYLDKDFYVKSAQEDRESVCNLEEALGIILEESILESIGANREDNGHKQPTIELFLSLSKDMLESITGWIC